MEIRVRLDADGLYRKASEEIYIKNTRHCTERMYTCGRKIYSTAGRFG